MRRGATFILIFASTGVTVHRAHVESRARRMSTKVHIRCAKQLGHSDYNSRFSCVLHLASGNGGGGGGLLTQRQCRATVILLFTAIGTG